MITITTTDFNKMEEGYKVRLAIQVNQTRVLNAALTAEKEALKCNLKKLDQLTKEIHALNSEASFLYSLLNKKQLAAVTLYSVREKEKVEQESYNFKSCVEPECSIIGLP